jgi:trk system potassium uptake protein TrkH
LGSQGIVSWCPFRSGKVESTPSNDIPEGRRARRPGDRVIRRRLRESRTIDLSEEARPRRQPSPSYHARIFIGIFAGIAFVGTFLLMLPWTTRDGEATAPTDALFTAMSALAVTGLVTVDTQTHWNWFGQVVILLLIQIGGLGFMVGASIVLSTVFGGVHRLRHQMLISDNLPTLSLSDSVDMARRIARFTLIVEAIGALMLTLLFLPEQDPLDAIWHGIFHSVSAFCNAGFDLQGNFRSLTAFEGNVPLNIVFIVLIQLGALSYLAFHDIGENRRWHRLSVNTRIVMAFNAILIVIGMSFFLASEWNGAMSHSPEWTRPLQALFESVSGRTAGFTTTDFSDVSTVTTFSWVGLMFIGGASGSTAGGIKMATIAVVLIAALSEMRGRSEPEIFRRRIPISLVMRAMTLVMTFLVLNFAFTLALSSTEHLYGQDPPFASLLFETVSAQATNGLSTGITPGLSTPGKLILVAAMFIGRLGPLTLAYALAQQRQPPRYRFPDTNVHIG